MRINLVHAAEGALGGLVGTAFMMQGLGLAQNLPEPMKPVMPQQDPGEFMVQKAEQLVGRPLPTAAHGALAHGLHWAYGTSWGTMLGLATPFIRTWPKALLAGAAMGAISWAAGYLGWLPATRLVQPIHRQGAGHATSSLLSHVLYGMIAAVPMYALHLLTGRRGLGRRSAVARLIAALV